jgi:hypothetical protein
MYETMPDIASGTTSYKDVYQALADMGYYVPVGTPLILQNKGSGGINVQVRNTAPISNSPDGNVLMSYEYYIAARGTNRIWIRNGTKVAVQVLVE